MTAGSGRNISKTNMGEYKKVYSLKEKVVVITGVSRGGIGEATAKRLAEAGAALYLANDDVTSLEPVAVECDRLRGEGPKTQHHSFDFFIPGQAEAMIENALSLFGRVDVLINNAAARVRRPFGEFSDSDFDKVISVIVKAPLYASQAVLPAMRKQGGGRIIHVASQMGLIAEKDSTLYGLAKAALIHLTKSMAYELAQDNIIVNAISPGPVMTGYNRQRTSKDPALLEHKLSYIPAQRYGRPEEIAEVIAFLAATSATYILGHNLVVDGGYVIH